MRNSHPSRAPDYTQAALVMMCVNLLWIFATLWVVLGMLPVLALAALLNHGITKLAEATRD